MSDPTFTDTTVDTRMGLREVVLIEWDHVGRGRGTGRTGRHRAMLLRDPEEGERALVSIEYVERRDSIGAPVWTRADPGARSEILSILMRERASKTVAS